VFLIECHEFVVERMRFFLIRPRKTPPPPKGGGGGAEKRGRLEERGGGGGGGGGGEGKAPRSGRCRSPKQSGRRCRRRVRPGLSVSAAQMFDFRGLVSTPATQKQAYAGGESREMIGPRAESEAQTKQSVRFILERVQACV